MGLICLVLSLAASREVLGMTLLLQFFAELPPRREGESTGQWARRLAGQLSRFEKAVRGRYTEGTLQRLLASTSTELRQAAVLALGLIGTMAVNRALAARLHDEEPAVRQLASDSLWALWFRAEAPEHTAALQRLLRQSRHNHQRAKVLAGLDALIRAAPRFAEAYNQRAMAYFRQGDFALAAADCEQTLRLNPCHFGAASGLGMCYHKQKKIRAALRAYRRALRLHPHLDGLRQAIESLERMVEEGDL